MHNNDVVEVSVETTYALRRQLLRQDRRDLALRMPDDDLPGVIHLAVLDELGEATAVVTLTPSRPDFAVRQPAYRLRQMAVRPDRARQGLGSALFVAAVSRLRARGVATLWAETRDSSVDFYLKNGMHVVSGRHHIVGDVAYTDMTIDLTDPNGHPPPE
jgi:GNAT superfamily N-acetyltransferase